MAMAMALIHKRMPGLACVAGTWRESSFDGGLARAKQPQRAGIFGEREMGRNQVNDAYNARAGAQEMLAEGPSQVLSHGGCASQSEFSKERECEGKSRQEPVDGGEWGDDASVRDGNGACCQCQVRVGERGRGGGAT